MVKSPVCSRDFSDSYYLTGPPYHHLIFFPLFAVQELVLVPFFSPEHFSSQLLFPESLLPALVFLVFLIYLIYFLLSFYPDRTLQLSFQVSEALPPLPVLRDFLKSSLFINFPLLVLIITTPSFIFSHRFAFHYNKI